MFPARLDWNRILTHDGRFSIEDHDYRRVYLIHVLLMVLVVFSLFFTVVDLLVFRMAAAAIVNLTAGLAAVGILWRFGRRHDVEWAALSAVTLVLVVLSGFLAVVEHQHDAFIFISIAPPVIFFLLDTRKALAFTGLFYLYLAVFIVLRHSAWQPVPFDAQSIFNLAGASAALVLLVRFFAKSREDALQMLEEKKRTLEESHRHLAEKQAVLEHQNQELARLTITDRLTGVSNRMKLDQVVDAEIIRARRFERPLSVILADIDHFKRINDCYGHLAGDRVLAQIAATLRNSCRNVDVVGRWGGEEFLIVCPECDAAAAGAIADRILAAVLMQDFSLADESLEPGCSGLPPVGVTLSLGVAAFRPGDTGDSLLKRADDAMYLAKQRGRRRVETLR